MTTAGEIVKLAPLPIRMLPRWLRKRFTSLLMKRLDVGDGYAPIGEPPPAMRYDFQIVGEMSQQIKPFSRLDKMVLLLGGTKIPNHLTLALKEPAATLPNVTRRTLRDSIRQRMEIQSGSAPLVVADAIRGHLQG